MAWQKRVLRVDLTKGTCNEEPLNMEWAMQYLGQRGLANRYLAEEIDPKSGCAFARKQINYGDRSSYRHYRFDGWTVFGSD